MAYNLLRKYPNASFPPPRKALFSHFYCEEKEKENVTLISIFSLKPYSHILIVKKKKSYSMLQ